MQNFFSVFFNRDLCVFDERKSLFDKVVAFAELVDCVVDQIACHVIETVREIVQFFGVMPVVIEHVVEKRESFLRRGCRSVRVRMSVRMSDAVGMCMRVAVTAVLVRMSMLVVVFVDLLFMVCCDDFASVICTHFCASSVRIFLICGMPSTPACVPVFSRLLKTDHAVSYPFIVIKYVVFLKALQPHMGVIFTLFILV